MCKSSDLGLNNDSVFKTMICTIYGLSAQLTKKESQVKLEVLPKRSGCVTIFTR